MQLRRIWDGATLLVQLNVGQGWIDVREIRLVFHRGSPRTNSRTGQATWLHSSTLRQVFVPTLLAPRANSFPIPVARRAQ